LKTHGEPGQNGRLAAKEMRMSWFEKDPRPSSRRSFVVAVLALAAGALLVWPARDAGARIRRPITLRIEGFLDAAPDGVKPLRTIEVRLGKEKSRMLAVTKIINQGSGPLGQTILDEAARYKPAFRLLGDTEIVAKLVAAPQGARVTLTGNLSSGRNVLLSIADVAAAPAAPATGS
jgi:hypothetical protein